MSKQRLGRNPFQKSSSSPAKPARSGARSGSGAKRTAKPRARTPSSRRRPSAPHAEGVLESLIVALRELVEQMLAQVAAAVRRWATA